MFASICCKIITIIAINTAFPRPPVNIVINTAIITATIAPKYGIKLNKPIINPSNTEYFTFNIDIAIDTNIPTNIASNTWLVKNLKNISFPLTKYFFILKYVLSLNIAFVSFDKKPIILVLCSNIYTDTIIAINASNIVSIALTTLFMYVCIFSMFTKDARSIFFILSIISVAFSLLNILSSGKLLIFPITEL